MSSNKNKRITTTLLITFVVVILFMVYLTFQCFQSTMKWDKEYLDLFNEVWNETTSLEFAIKDSKLREKIYKTDDDVLIHNFFTLLDKGISPWKKEKKVYDITIRLNFYEKNSIIAKAIFLQDFNETNIQAIIYLGDEGISKTYQCIDNNNFFSELIRSFKYQLDE